MTPASESGTADLVELTVTEIGAGGDGIASWQGERVFVPFAAPDDRVRARLGPRRGGGREGRIVALLAAGPGRAAPVCRHFGRCGGCALQHLDAARYQAAKLGGLHRALARVGIDPGLVEPLRTVPPARRRVRLGLARSREEKRPATIGLRQRFSHRLIDLRECPVIEPALFALIEPLRRLAPALLPAGAADITLTRTDSGIDMLIKTREPPALPALEALSAFAATADLARITWRVPATEIPVVERRPVRARLSGVSVAVPPGAFVQASAAAENLLVETAVAAASTRRPALDLFSGLGPFAFALAAAGGPVHAVEGEEAASAALARAAAGVSGMTVEQRDLARNPLSPAELAPYAAALFDPPRAGAAAQAAALAKAEIDVVVAVSCNPATFARDAHRLIDGGYRLERIAPIDQFVWTPHVELAAVFRR